MKSELKIDEKKLFLLCAKKGLLYKDLAKLLGVTPTTVYGYRKHRARADTLCKLAEVLECEPGDLL